MRKKVIQIGLEFVFGPLLKNEDDQNGNPCTGVRIVDENESIQSLDKEIGELWCSLYSKDDNAVDGLHFDDTREKELAPILLEKINLLIIMLNEINDGSYEIDDMITSYLKILITE